MTRHSIQHLTQHLDVDGGTLAYETSGASGPLVLLAHGMGDSREAYRFLVPALVAAGYRVAAVDLRGCGQSSTGWASYTRTDIAGDLIALVEHLGGPAILVGHSIAGGAVTIAAALAPSLVTAVVELAPFTRKQSVSLRDLRDGDFRRGMTHLTATGMLGSRKAWRKYLDLAYPGPKPADYDARLAQIEAMLAEPGRMKAMQAMCRTKPADAGEQLANVHVPGAGHPGRRRPRLELPAGRGRGHRRRTAQRTGAPAGRARVGALPARPARHRSARRRAALPRRDDPREPRGRPRCHGGCGCLGPA